MPQQPPRDAAGAVLPHDHSEITEHDGIIRRISDKQLITDASGRRRVSSLAYQASEGPNGGMSIDIESFILAAGQDPLAHVTTPRWIGSVKFEAGQLRSLGLQVGYDPLPDNAHHGEVWGDLSRQKRKLQKMAAWYVPISDAETV